MSAALYSSLDLTIGDLERIKLPLFQRKLVWTQKKKEDFIDTLRQGLPFGAVLIYPEDQTNESMLQILDGQQRLSTILEYKKMSAPFLETAKSRGVSKLSRPNQRYAPR